MWSSCARSWMWCSRKLGSSGTGLPPGAYVSERWLWGVVGVLGITGPVRLGSLVRTAPGGSPVPLSHDRSATQPVAAAVGACSRDGGGSVPSLGQPVVVADAGADSD